MGRKVHPMGFRIGVIRDWQSKWYDDKHYAEFIIEDVNLRKAVQTKYNDAGIAQIDIERQANKVSVTIHTSRPGIVIGRGGQRVEEMRQYLEKVLIDKKVQLDIREIRQPELDAYLVARSVAEQMERRVAYRRAMKQAIFRTMQAGAKGMRILCSGRLGGVEIARRQLMHQGRVPLQTLRADVDYGFTEAHTTLGRIGVKVWIYRGDILPAAPVVVAADVAAVRATAAPKGVSMAEVVSNMAEAPAKEADSAVAKVRKPRTRKSAESVTETKAVEEVKAEEKVDAKKVTKPQAKKAEPATDKTAEKADVKPVKAKTAKPKAEAVEETKPVKTKSETVRQTKSQSKEE